MNIPVEPCPHPTSFIDDEIKERGWDREALIAAMLPQVEKPELLEFMIEMYWLVGPTEPNLRMGPELVKGLSGAFGLSEQFFINLENGWLKDKIRTALSELEADNLIILAK